MTKPDDIPQDVWDKAYGQALLFVQWLVPAPTDYVQAEHVLAVSFARAIMAAKAEQKTADIGILLSFVEGHERNGATAVNPFIDAFAAAAAIRKRGEAE